ncbi:MAG: glycosyltransferase [Lachnospiraceae bacterium]|nr:glycosyltransferase [Lachnospiraceae bacterium]
MAQKNFINSTAGQLPAVSIIVPVYNAENTLDRCVDSVLRQDYKNFELILVNDGSTDSSGAICDHYAAQDHRVHVIHKQNSGVSDSRNLALAQAKGTYLQFVDADDWIAPEATGLLVTAAKAHSCDMVIADFYRVIDNRIAHKGDIQEEGLLSRKEFATYMMEKPADYYYGVLWNKLYKRELIRQYQLRMNAEISWCEDFMFNLEYICHVQNIYVLRVPLYYYVRTKHSLSAQGASITKTIQMKITVFEYYRKFYKEVFDDDDYEKSRLQVYRFLLDAASDGIVPPALLPGSLKLGEERVQINPSILESNDALSDIYLKRKCFEACLQPACFRYGLKLNEVRLLFCLSPDAKMYTRKELAELIGCSKRKLSSVLQSLKAHGYISWTKYSPADHEDSKTSPNYLEIRVLPAALPVLETLKNVQNGYREICFSGFTEDEAALYDTLSKRIEENILRTLS